VPTFPKSGGEQVATLLLRCPGGGRTRLFSTIGLPECVCRALVEISLGERPSSSAADQPPTIDLQQRWCLGGPGAKQFRRPMAQVLVQRQPRSRSHCFVTGTEGRERGPGRPGYMLIASQTTDGTFYVSQLVTWAGGRCASSDVDRVPLAATNLSGKLGQAPHRPGGDHVRSLGLPGRELGRNRWKKNLDAAVGGGLSGFGEIPSLVRVHCLRPR